MVRAPAAQRLLVICCVTGSCTQVHARSASNVGPSGVFTEVMLDVSVKWGVRGGVGCSSFLKQGTAVVNSSKQNNVFNST